MGCCCACFQQNTWQFSEDRWTAYMVPKERRIFTTAGFKEGEWRSDFTMIEMDGAPFRVRTHWCNVSPGPGGAGKPTLVLLHGNMAFAAAYASLVRLLCEHYRVIMFDHMNLGLNTRSPRSHRDAINVDADKAEAWVLDFAEKTFDAVAELPDSFFVVTHSWGGYLGMLYASHHPERIAGMFCFSPPCTEPLDPAVHTNLPYGGISTAQTEKWETPASASHHLVRTANGKHPFHKELHDQGDCMKKVVMWVLRKVAYTAVFKHYPKAHSAAIIDYYVHMLARPGWAETTMEPMYQWPFKLKHSMEAEDRLCSPAVAAAPFPLAIGFGARDCFASSTGAESLLKKFKAHCAGGKGGGAAVNLFKLGEDMDRVQAGHTAYVKYEKEFVDMVVGHLSGTIVDRWEPTVYGAHIAGKAGGSKNVVHPG